MKLSTLFALTLLFLLVFGASNVSAQSGKLFTVDDIGDTHDSNVGDTFCADANGKCTLRAAIEEANANVYEDAVNFALPNLSTINLTLGELQITSDIYIIGPGARKLTVQRSPAAGTADFRIFHIFPNVASFLTIRGFKISNGKLPDGSGGGIYNEEGNFVRLSDLVITGNSANRGGGIANAGLLDLSRSLVSSNTAIGNSGVGGGFYNQQRFGDASIINSSFSENSAFDGGAIYSSAGRFYLVNDTFTHNSAVNSGCSIVNASIDSFNLINTIVGMDNSPTVSSMQGVFTSFGNNLITDARNTTGFTNGTNNDQVSDNNALNPLLGNLADNGGQTDTLALLSGSPAIDHGNNCVFNRTCASPFTNISLFTDQRENYLRQNNFGTVDVGAFEFNTFAIGNSAGSIGTFGGRTRTGGAIAIFTRAATNEKFYRIIGQTGFANYPTVDNGVYILEVRGKRAGSSSFIVFDFEGLIPFGIPFSQTSEVDGIKFTYEEKSSKK